MNNDGTSSARPAPRLFAFAKHAGRLERNSYASIARAILRRPAVPSGAKGFKYHSPVLTVLVVFLVLSAAELVIVDVIVHRWPLVRIPLLILGVWGVIYMVGMLCSFIMRPHAVGPEGIRVRSGMGVEAGMIRFWVDEPKEFLQEVASQIG